MESDLFQNYQPQQNQQQPNSGLVRYRSAPSSYFSNLLERDIYDELMINRPSSPETERIFARFMSSSGAGAGNDLRRNTLVGEVGQQQSAFPTLEKPKVEIFQQNLKQEQEQNNFISASSSQNYYQALLPNQNMDYRVVNPMGSSSTSGLIRQSSSPAGLFLNKNLEGYGSLSSMVGGAGESSFSPTGRFGDHMNYLARQTSTGKMSPIAEMESKGLGKCSPEGGGGFAEGHGNNYDAGFPLGSWDDSVDGAFSGLHASEAEDGEGRTSAHPRLLAHHLSLPSPKTTAEMSAFLPLQDSIPCKIRAKRGCATHPRSIAERVRRTKISERIRKLQDLVPNMDKQTNTADMLDLAVDYIKELQDQVKALSDDRSRCVCPNNQPL